MFSLADDTRDNLRSMLRAEPFNLNTEEENIAPAEKLRRRVAQAKVIDAWESAKSRVEEKKRTEAEQRALHQPLALPSGDHMNLRRVYENMYGKVDDKRFPADNVIERRLQEVEHHDILLLVAWRLRGLGGGTQKPDVHKYTCFSLSLSLYMRVCIYIYIYTYG